jgi:predicted metalloendopeptidase
MEPFLKKALLLTAAGLVAPALLIAACGRKETRTDSAVEEPAVDPNAPQIGSFGLAVKDIDAAVDPGDDFYAYVNGDWLKTFKISEEYSSYGSFTMLAERSEQRLKDIVEGLGARGPATGDAKKVRDFYASYLDVAAIDAKGLTPLAEDFAAIDAIDTPEKFAAYVSNPATRGRAPITFIISTDLKRPDRYALYAGQSGLGMPNRDYYLEEKFADKQAKYRAYIEQILTLAGHAGAAGAAQRIYDLELQMANVHWEPAKRRNRDLMYNLKTIEELESFAPGAPWRAMLSAAGLGDRAEIIVREDDAVQKLAALIAATPVETWRDYLKFHLVSANADVLPSAIDNANFAFFATELRGTPKQKERWKRAVAAVDASLGEAVGKLYVEQHFPPESKATMEALVSNLRAALNERIGALQWMSAETRGAARDKLSKFTAKIGYPDAWRDYSALEVRPGDAYGNAKRSQAFEWAFQAARIDEPVDRTEWGMTPPTVNAYYNPPLNEIVFPAGILDAPFFDPKADAAVNYGAIGAVIGHEIGHGFDDQGRKSDGDGVLRDWWSPADVAAFQKVAAKIGAQYSAYEPIEGFPVNPELTMGENIGDIGGLAMAYHAYKLSLNGEEAPVIDGLTGDQRFFLAWGQVWKRVVRDEQLKNQIATDPHAPAQYRVNGVVRNMRAWYDAFGVTPDDDLYLPPEERVEIW